MNTMKSNNLIRRSTAKSEHGAAMIDYAILTCMIAVVSLGALMTFGDQVKRVYCERIMQIKFMDANKIPILSWKGDDESHKNCITPNGESPDPLF